MLTIKACIPWKSIVYQHGRSVSVHFPFPRPRLETHIGLGRAEPIKEGFATRRSIIQAAPTRQNSGLKRLAIAKRENHHLSIVSWNIDFASPYASERCAKIMDYLQRQFRPRFERLIIMLQEVCPKSLEQICQTPWIQQNFVVYGNKPLPTIVQDGLRRSARYFTLVLTPRTLKLERCFRISMPSELGRDALFVDIASDSKTNRPGKQVVRLCTTHLESLGGGVSIRKRQLGIISKHLTADANYKIIAGIVGGDMNAISDEEDSYPVELGLRDAWLEGNTSVVERTTIEDRGCTWGYQPRTARWEPKRFDRFLYRGDLKLCSLSDRCEHDSEQRAQRLGIGLTTSIDPPDADLDNRGSVPVLGPKVWVSDHFGIMIKIEIPS